MQINRLFEIIYILLNKKTITAKELAEKFEVSIRTIYRDIDTLSAAGIPLYTSQGKGGGISMLDDYVLDKSLLSENEQNEILYALQSLTVTQVPVDDNVLDKLSKLFKKSRTSWIEVDFSPWGSDKNRANQFIVIRHAILNREVIEFEYFNSNGEKRIRRVEPAKLVFKVNAWYIQGFCLTKNTLRTFKISRMSNLTIYPETFTERPLDQSCKVEQEQEAQKWIDVTLKISNRGAYRVYDEFNEKCIIENENGSFTVTTSLPENKWLIRYLLSFGADLEVVAPPHIRDMLKSELNGIKNNYI
ncbi:helix-turn-helix transcriptional regulator [Paenibacillus paeoniae]|uniref:YafY family transcriptional regulator n=1 Tax=Paenibacillus paeoniae TaxID=2292705 RepID=A0A371PJP7_9BACL|nr:YafY family protein [Paenibacillus paeoniae]REK76422.1 YafY family transcriptional regulator [Paenibacillus paeoniae]